MRHPPEFTHRITLPSMNETRLLFDEATLSYFREIGYYDRDILCFVGDYCYSGFAKHVKKRLETYFDINHRNGDDLYLSGILIYDTLGEIVDVRATFAISSAKLDLLQLRRDLPSIMEVKLQSHPGILSSWSDVLITKLDTEALYLGVFGPMPRPGGEPQQYMA